MPSSRLPVNAAQSPVADEDEQRPASDPAPEFDATRGVRAYESIVAHVERQVEEGALKPGDKLPSERELAERFRVGRSSVRDAIRILEVRGVVKPRQGGGTVVQDLSSESLVSVLANALKRKRSLVQELMDVRCIIEPALAARAAEYATPEQIAHLEDIVERQRVKLSLGGSGVEEDAEFHDTVARAAGNTVMLAVLGTLIGLLSETRRSALQVKGRSMASVEGHRRVLNAIRRRAPEAAEAAMRRHIQSVESIIFHKRS